MAGALRPVVLLPVLLPNKEFPVLAKSPAAGFVEVAVVFPCPSPEEVCAPNMPPLLPPALGVELLPPPKRPDAGLVAGLLAFPKRPPPPIAGVVLLLAPPNIPPPDEFPDVPAADVVAVPNIPPVVGAAEDLAPNIPPAAGGVPGALPVDAPNIAPEGICEVVLPLCWPKGDPEALGVDCALAPGAPPTDPKENWGVLAPLALPKRPPEAGAVLVALLGVALEDPKLKDMVSATWWAFS